MREIKFRAWDKQHKVMVENVTPFQSDFVLERGMWECLKSHDDKGEASFRLYGHTFDVLMQFTGLYDKKKKPIYEGDILHFDASEWGSEKGSNFVIEWNNKIGGWDGNGSTSDWSEWCTIIGNKFENPKLLKGGEKCST